MTKKHDFIRSEQSMAAKRRAASTDKASAKGNPADHQLPHTPKLANDHNKVGNKEPTQTHQGQRTPQSRHERQVLSGGPMNVVQARTGGKGGGRGPRGAG